MAAFLSNQFHIILAIATVITMYSIHVVYRRGLRNKCWPLRSRLVLGGTLAAYTAVMFFLLHLVFDYMEHDIDHGAGATQNSNQP